MATLNELLRAGIHFRHFERTPEEYKEVAAAMLACENTDRFFPTVVWLKEQDAAELTRLEDLACVTAAATGEDLAIFTPMEDEEFDSLVAYRWKLARCLRDRCALEGVLVMLKRLGRGQKLRRELDLLNALHEPHAKHYGDLIVGYLEEPLKVEHADVIREAAWKFHDAWWGVRSIGDAIELAQIEESLEVAP
jgi:hypothetical protein